MLPQYPHLPPTPPHPTPTLTTPTLVCAGAPAAPGGRPRPWAPGWAAQRAHLPGVSTAVGPAGRRLSLVGGAAGGPSGRGWRQRRASRCAVLRCGHPATDRRPAPRCCARVSLAAGAPATPPACPPPPYFLPCRSTSPSGRAPCASSCACCVHAGTCRSSTTAAPVRLLVGRLSGLVGCLLGAHAGCFSGLEAC